MGMSNTMSELSGMDRRIQKQFWTRRRLIYVSIGVVGAAAIIYGLISLAGGSALRLEASRLTVSSVTEGPFQEFIPVSGVVTPLKTFYLDAVQGGRVTEILAEQGAMLKTGDPILRVENTDLRLDIMYREAQLYEQINNLRNTRIAMEQRKLQLKADLLEVDRMINESKRKYDVADYLRKKDLASPDELNRAKEEFDYWSSKRVLTIETQRQDSVLRSQQVEQLEGSVSRMNTNLEFVRKRLEDLVLRAPIDGQLTSLNAEVGESKGFGERLGQIDVLDGFMLQANVEEYYVARIDTGQLVMATLGGAACSLKVSKVYPEIANGKFRVDLIFISRTPSDLRRGQTLQVRLMLGDLSRAVLLPRGSFYNTTGGRWVYLLRAGSDIAFRQDVELGRQNTEVYEVLKGLKAGDRVITSSYETYAQYEKIIVK
jgi:HlyD family secretion protein